VLQRRIKTIQCQETTSLGTAVLAAAGTGGFANIEAAIAAMVHPAATISPDIHNQEVYDAAFRKYRELNRRNFSA
jgi:sugar (pentulose or hexulose) kinase